MSAKITLLLILIIYNTNIIFGKFGDTPYTNQLTYMQPKFSDESINKKVDDATDQVHTVYTVPKNNTFNHVKEKVCTDIDVRSNETNLEVLRGCTVVEGFVQIELIDNATPQQFNGISFPELREITEYLLFYHVSGLTSLGNLFPNLSLIRGNNLVWEYTFSIFSMYSLTEIRLPRLTHIHQGTIMIAKNPSLCYAESIDWPKIAKKSDILINKLRPIKECNEELEKQKTVQCGHHWSPNICQMTKEIDNCHKLCAGGCSGPTSNDCFVCRGIVHEGQCLEKCPPNRYLYMNRRCLTKVQCLNNERITSKNFPKGMRMSYADDAKWRAFNGTCIDECPAGYNSSRDETTCVKCIDSLCPKVCSGVSVNSIDKARALKGCTQINGSLEIKIRTGNSSLVASELESGLGMIQEIFGHFKIIHSEPIQSLSFLKQLKVVHGIQDISPLNNYSFVVWDNDNLQDLWDWSTKQDGEQFEIKQGKILFHDNPKLCMEKINKLLEITSHPFYEISSESNGVAFTCAHSNIDLILSEKSDVAVYLKIKFLAEKIEPNLRFVLFYLKIDGEVNITFNNAGNCEKSSWKMKDISAEDKTCNVTDLEPYTKYAFYVKVYGDKIIRSDIIYETTLPSKPSMPLQFRVVDISSQSVSLSWKGPKSWNGISDKYILKVYSHAYDLSEVDARDYCQHKAVLVTDTTMVPPTTSKFTKATTKDCCSKNVIPCEGKHDFFSHGNPHQQYIEQCGDTSIFEFLQANELRPEMPYVPPNNVTLEPNQTLEIKAWNTSIVIPELSHFQNYMLHLSACRQEEMDDPVVSNIELNKARCSVDSRVFVKTRIDPLADVIEAANIHLGEYNTTHYRLGWSPPAAPNGMIVSYLVEYIRNDYTEHDVLCFTRTSIEKNNGTYFNVVDRSGDYRFRVRAISLAGDGPWTHWKSCSVKENIETTRIFQILYVMIVPTTVLFIIIVYLLYKQKTSNKNSLLFTSVNPEYYAMTYKVDEWEVEREDVELGRLLGRGTFGIVYEGYLKSKDLKCAIKTISDDVSDRYRINFLNEATTMKTFTAAHNVVKLLGVVSRGHPPLIVIELMALGDLKTFLRSNRGISLASLILIKMAAQIADGMEYMESRKFVHRDLASRNCMVAGDLSVKIGDLGMSRDIYENDYYRKGGRGLLPVRWMAPESLKDGIFTNYSDVWSYGVVLWEMLTFAEQPYQGMTNTEVLDYIIEGSCLNDTEFKHDSRHYVIYDMMVRCWARTPSTRPTFHEIVSSYEEYLDDIFRSTSYHHNPSEDTTVGDQDDITTTSNSNVKNTRFKSAVVTERNALLDEITTMRGQHTTAL